MNVTYLNSIADFGAGLITHIGLVSDGGVEIASPGYARQPVTWTASANGLVSPTTDLVFSMTSGDQVGGWRGYSAATAGTDYGGALLASVTFSNDGTYTLNAAGTNIDHNSV